MLFLFRARTVISSRKKEVSKNGSTAARAAASPLSQASTSDLLDIAFQFSFKNVLFSNSGPMCFQPMRTNDSSCRTRAPPSLCVAQGVPPPDPGAPTPQHSWRINISHTFSQQLLKPLGRPCPQTRATHSRDTGTRPLGAPETALGCDQTPLQSPFRVFRCHLI